MARVADTSVWIERFVGSETGRRLAPMFPAFGDCVVPTIVQLELAKWARREFSEDLADRILAMTADCVVIDLDTRIAAWAAEVCHRHKLATADAIVYATALAAECDRLTCDRHFEGLDHVVYVAKA